MDTQSPIKTRLAWSELVPSDWLKLKNKGLWISGFNVMGIKRDELSNGYKVLDLDAIKVVILYGQLKYIDVSTIGTQSSDTPTFKYQVDEKATSDGAHLIIIQLVELDNGEAEFEAEKNTEIVAGFLSSFLGQNIVYNQIFNNIWNPQDNKHVVTGPVIRNPLSLPKPDISDNKIQVISLAYKKLTNLPEIERNRIELSLRWYYQSLNSSGVDVFLKLWVALEALGMSTTENIKPLIQIIANAYGISFVEAKTKFSIGKLFGFRSQIMHHGEIPAIHSRLSDYVEALYVDILFERLGLSTERRAEKILTNPMFSLHQLLIFQ